MAEENKHFEYNGVANGDIISGSADSTNDNSMEGMKQAREYFLKNSVIGDTFHIAVTA